MIFQSSSKPQFLEEVAKIAINNSASDFTKLKILLPSGLACSAVQKILVNHFGSCILPKIIPISELVAENEEIFKIPSEQIGCISKLEEKVIITSIIYDYKILEYDLIQSLRLAPSLANLFFELEANNINLKDIKQLPVLDQPEHWHKIFDFLSFAFDNWQTKIQAMKKMTRASYQQLMFSAEIQRLKNDKSQLLLLAGVVGNNFMTTNFIKNAISLDNCQLILPPNPIYPSNQEVATENTLYKIYNLMELIKGGKERCHSSLDHSSVLPCHSRAGGNPEKLLLDSRLRGNDKMESWKDISVTSLATPRANNIQYLEFENMAHEAEYIALYCARKLAKNPKNKIALVVHNQHSKEQYQTFLDKYSLGYQDQFGEDIINQHSVSLILLVADMLCCEFNLKKFFSFLAHPLINSIKSQELKNLIRKTNRFASSLNTISSIAKNEELQEYFETIANVLSRHITSSQFASILIDVIKATEQLVPTIWQKDQNMVASIAEIVQLKSALEIKDKEYFPEILRQIIDGGRLFSSTHEQQIIICRPNSSAFINYDLIIITDLNEGSYPNTLQSSPWLSKQMQKTLGLDNRQTEFSASLYYFYLNIQNAQVLLTRAKKQGTNKLTLASPFILNLKHILGDKLETKLCLPTYQQTVPKTLEKSSRSKFFPDVISATDIETLIRAPYNFYAKKILKLRKIEEIDERPNLAEFGNFFHLVVEQYTKNYEPGNAEKSLCISSIAESILANSFIPDHSKRSWKIKLAALTDEFIEFDENRRKIAVKVYSEIKGRTTLNIDGQSIIITAIADRIELGLDGLITILDFKTGSVPTKKDVLSGLSPQLIVEAIIASEGGFDIMAPSNSKEVSLIYVKIASSSPYIRTNEIIISQDEIAKHKQGLSTLIGHYMYKAEFPTEPNLMKYDDYSHLARRNS